MWRMLCQEWQLGRCVYAARVFAHSRCCSCSAGVLVLSAVCRSRVVVVSSLRASQQLQKHARSTLVVALAWAVGVVLLWSVHVWWDCMHCSGLQVSALFGRQLYVSCCGKPP